MATIDAAEAVLLDFERILVQLPGRDRSDLSIELERLSMIGTSNNATEDAADTPRNTGANRVSLVWERGHALAHSEIIPKYGELIAAGVAARKPHPGNWQAADAAEAEIAQAYAEAKAADIERYGVVGSDAWHIAWAAALFGHCEECDRPEVD